MANEVKLIITTDSTGAVAGIKKVGEEFDKVPAKSQGVVEQIKANWVEVSVAIAGAWMAAGKAMEYVDLGAKALQAEESFSLVTKSAEINSERLIGAMSRAAAGTIDDSDIMQKAVKGLVQGLDDAQLVHIMDAARVSARVAGEDVKTAYENITDAIANNLPRALRRYGLLAKEDIALVNKALAAGIEDAGIYELAMANAAIQAAKFGEINDTVAEQLQRHRAEVHQLHEDLGKLTANAWSIAISVPASQWAAIKNFVAYLRGDEYAIRDRSEETTGAYIPAPSSEEAKKAYLDDQEKAKQSLVESTKAKTEAKKAEEAAAKDAERMQKEILAALTQANKEHYEQAIAEANQWLIVQRDNGANEYALIMDYWGKKNDAIYESYSKEWDYIDQYTQREEEKNAKLSALDAKYLKEKDTNDKELQKNQIEAAKKTIEVEANLYKIVNEYSDESIEAQIVALKKRYIEQGRYTDKSELLAEALAKDETALYSKREKAILAFYQKTGRYGEDAADLIESLAIDEYNNVIDLLDDEEEAEKAYNEFKVKAGLEQVQSEKKASLDKLAAYQSLYKDLQGYEGQYYAVSKRLIIEKSQTDLAILLRDVTDFREVEQIKQAVATATTLKLKQLDVEKGKSSRDFLEGVAAGFAELTLKQTTWGTAGYEITKAFTTSSAKELETNLFQLWRGNFEDINVDWQNTLDSMGQALAKALADMIIKASAQKILLSFESKWTDGGASVIGQVANVLGKVIDWTGLGSSPGGGTDILSSDDLIDDFMETAYAGSAGGWVPGVASVPGNSYANDKVRAWLSPDEYVIDRETAAAIAAQGRGGDTMIAHINPAEAALLRAVGGKGTRNPRTGLLEFYQDAYSSGGREAYPDWATFDEFGNFTGSQYDLDRWRETQAATESYTAWYAGLVGSDAAKAIAARQYWNWTEAGRGDSSTWANLNEVIAAGPVNAQIIIHPNSTGMLQDAYDPDLVKRVYLTWLADGGYTLQHEAFSNAVADTQGLSGVVGNLQGLSMLASFAGLATTVAGLAGTLGTAATAAEEASYLSIAEATGQIPSAFEGLSSAEVMTEAALRQAGSIATKQGIRYAIRQALGLVTGAGGDSGGHLQIGYAGADDGGLLASLAASMQEMEGQYEFPLPVMRAHKGYSPAAPRLADNEMPVIIEDTESVLTEGQIGKIGAKLNQIIALSASNAQSPDRPIELNLTINLDGRAVSQYLYTVSSKGTPVVHPRGVR